jgi:hypothetical protein
MTTLTGRSPGNTYKDLLQVSNSNAGVDATLRSVSDGEGTDSALQISTTEAKVNGDLTVTGSVSLSTGLPVSSGGTGATTEANARIALGLAIGTDVQAYDADLGALAGLSSAGMVARTGAGTAAARTIAGTAAEITVTNGDGVSGAPTISIPTAVTLTGKTLTAGTFSAPTVTGTWTATGATCSDLGTVTTANIDGGTVDGAVIGGASAAAVTTTTLTVTASIWPHTTYAVSGSPYTIATTAAEWAELTHDGDITLDFTAASAGQVVTKFFKYLNSGGSRNMTITLGGSGTGVAEHTGGATVTTWTSVADTTSGFLMVQYSNDWLRWSFSED